MQLIELIYLMLPAYVANMAAPFAKFWPGRNPPISRRWLGDHKTIIGFLLGVAAGVLTSYLQSEIPWSPDGLEPTSRIAVGLVQGIGAMSGDAAKSFFKRRIGVAPGQPWLRLISSTSSWGRWHWVGHGCRCDRSRLH
jgi:CDP-2,3-bis-(O-geranylgeranyl)-sn-glycerol synthase